MIRETFIDPTFNHQGKCRQIPFSISLVEFGRYVVLKLLELFADWDLKLQQTMVEMFPLRSEDAAYNKIKGMLSTLGDPFTRIISPKVFKTWLQH